MVKVREVGNTYKEVNTWSVTTGNIKGQAQRREPGLVKSHNWRTELEGQLETRGQME